MGGPEVILWTSVKGLGYKALLQIKGMLLKSELEGDTMVLSLNYGLILILNYVTNSYLFNKFVIEL